jgi:hypothetical protein
MFMLLGGKNPFVSETTQSIDDLKKSVEEGRCTLQTKDPISAEGALLLTELLQSDSADRISGEELFDHPFLQLDRDLTPLEKVLPGFEVTTENGKCTLQLNIND